MNLELAQGWTVKLALKAVIIAQLTVTIMKNVSSAQKIGGKMQAVPTSVQVW
jgi:hypothetical protein